MHQQNSKPGQWDSSLQQNAATIAQDQTTDSDLNLLLLSIGKVLQRGSSPQQDTDTMVLDEINETTCWRDSDLDPDLLPLSTDKSFQWHSSLQQNAAAIVRNEAYHQNLDLDLLFLSTDKVSQWGSLSLSDE